MILTLLLWVIAFFALAAGAPSPSFWGGPGTSDNSPTSAAERLRSQYNFPKEILAVLSIIGGDIIQKACAQEAGTSPITPVAFSFGWVAYAFSALMSAFSDGSLMPETYIASVVIDVDRGHWRQNESWVLGSLQFTLAVLPIMYDHQNWSILYVTGAGTLLAFCSGSLPSWKWEKYNEGATVRARKGRKFALTRGNGHGHVFVIEIEGDRAVVPFDILATIPRAKPERWSRRWKRLGIVILALGWIFVLIAVGGMEEDTWMLLLIGGVGMLQNVWVAGRKRNPEEHGIPLEKLDVVQRDQGTEAVLNDVEKRLPGLGLALLESFFPGGVFHDHHWNEMRKTVEERKAMDGAAKVQNQGPAHWEHDDHPEDMLVFKNKAGRYLCKQEPTPLATNSHPHTTHPHGNSGLSHRPSP